MIWNLSAYFLLVASSSILMQSNERKQMLAELEDAMLERVISPAERLKLVARWDAVLKESPDDEVWSKVRFVESVAFMRLGKLDDSLRAVEELCSSTPLSRYPDLRFRARGMLAVNKFLLGDTAGSLDEFTSLLEGPKDGVALKVLHRTRINYASVLIESGTTNAAISVYEDLMLESMETGEDETAMHAGANLVVAFLTQKDNLAARRALEQVQPVVDRNPRTQLADSLVLSSIDLDGIDGKMELAEERVRKFIALEPAALDETLTRAYRILSEIQIKQGKYPEALSSAQAAEKLAGENSKLLSTVCLALARAQVELGNFREAIESIDKVDGSMFNRPQRAVELEEVRLRAELELQDNETALEVLDRMLAALSTNDSYNRERSAKYHAARIAMVEEERRLLNSASRRQFWYMLVGISFVAGVVTLFFGNRWYLERIRLNSEREQRDNLQTLVEEKTQDLVKNYGEKLEIEAELQRVRRLDAIGSIAGNVAHDINNLLQVVSGAIHVSLESDTTGNVRDEGLRIALDSVSHGATVVRNLLSYAGRQDLTPVVLDVQNYIEENQALLQSAITRPNQFCIEDSSTDSRIKVDESQLTTSLLNLLSNADQATDGGAITLKVASTQITENSPQMWPDLPSGAYLKFSVVDTGCGMTNDQLDRALEPFYTTKGENGTGLGLSSVYGFVKQSGGDLRIESQAGGGTTVEVLLPLADEPMTRRAVQRAPAEMRGKHVLVVDDNERVGEMVCGLLKMLGCSVDTCVNTEQVRRLLDEDSKQFSFVLSDVSMPGDMDGFELAQWIKQNHPHLKVVLMSGYTQKLESSGVPTLHKPFSIGELQAALSRSDRT